MEKITAKALVEKLNLYPSEELSNIGYTYRSKEPENGGQPVISSACFVVKPGTVSSFRYHIGFDEVLLHQLGKPLECFVIDTEGNYTIYSLGTNIFKGEVPQVNVPENYVLAVKVKNIKDENDYDFCFYTCVCGHAWNNEQILSEDYVIEKFPKVTKEVLEKWKTDV